MVITTIIGMIVGLISVPATIVGKIPSLEPTFGVVFTHLHEIFTPELITVIFTFLFVAFFDTAGAFIGLTSQAGIMKNNTFPYPGRALLAASSDSVDVEIIGLSSSDKCVVTL